MSVVINCPDCGYEHEVSAAWRCPNCASGNKESAHSASTNRDIMQLLGRFLTLEDKWMDYAGPVAVFRGLCAEARKLGATAQ